jgi:hypothetical protein
MGLIISLVIAIIMCVIAAKKGFNPVLWFFSLGLIGLIVVLCLKSAKAPGIDEAEAAARRKRGNTVGGVLTGITAVIIVIGIIAVVGSR